MSWQKPARIGAALVGLLSAAGVYFAMGERRVPPPAGDIQARDPLAKVEISGCNLKNFPGLTKNFEVTCDLMSTYEDGRIKLTGNPVTILVHKGENRTFKITGKEVRVSRDSNFFEVFGGPVRLEDSDGFWLETDMATANQADSISHVPGAATFGKGRMSGSGIGFSYDNNREVLLISKQARVKTVNEHGKVVTDMASGTAMLDRLQHLLKLDTGVHVLRDDQVIDTDHANGRLSAGNDVVTGIELYGNSRVVGGPSIDNMKARDITLDYTDDGKTLESAKLIGGASIAMKGTGGAPGRRIEGEETVDVTLASDGMLTSAVARENVRLDLPGDAEAPRRSITAQTLDGTGEAGKGLTQVTFTRDVSFTEEPLRSKGASADNQSDMRTAHAQRLEASLADDAVTKAVFSRDVTFEEAGLKACAEMADYNPQKGSLNLSGATKDGLPIVAEEKVAIEAQTVDVTLDTRLMTAQGTVRASFRSKARRCQPAKERPSAEQGAANVPRLLKADAPVTVVAPALAYDSKKGVADFKGRPDARVTLEQDQEQERTQISADRLVLDQTKGDLIATGNVKSTMPLDGKDTRTQSHRMVYSDEQRFLTFASQPKTPKSEVSLLSPDSTLRAASVEITLEAEENKAKTMRARGNVRLAQDPHTITGGDTLGYTASNEQFEVKGNRGQKVTVVTRDSDGCRQNEGNLVTFTKGKNAVTIDGQIRNSKTAPLKAGSCAPSTR